MTCEHLGRAAGQQSSPLGPIVEYACRHPKHGSTTKADCALCPDYLPQPASLSDPAAEHAVLPPVCRHPQGVFVDRYGRDAAIADLYKGAHCFLLAGGPSVLDLDLAQLSRRGVLLFSGNHWLASLPQGIRPTFWTSTDPAEKFSDSIWRDPGVLKFVAVREWTCRRKSLRRRTADGQGFEYIPDAVPRGMPGILGYHRNTCFDPGHWLYEPTINRGNDKQSADANGHPRVINTMFTVLRIAFYLGIEHLYLLGCDFKMEEGQPYAFEVEKSAGAVESNNCAYRNMDWMLGMLAPKFEQAGFHVWNCNAKSGLTAFPHLPYAEAIRRATETFEQWPISTRDWYTKGVGPLVDDT
ncbi:MAG: hypothetical protein ABFD92_21435 [Planctomycetaceae bacterium]